MARLNRPRDSPHVIPAADRKSSPDVNTSTVMDSPILQPVSLDASLQSHGNYNLPSSPASRDSVSPADCRTLEKILRAVSTSSAPQTPSPSGLIEQQLLDDGDGGVTFHSFTENEAAHAAQAAHRALGGEVTDAGYKDDDDSMELTEGLDSLTARSTSISDLDLVSTCVSKSERRLLDSVSMHAEKDRQRYVSRRSWTEQYPKTKYREQQQMTQIEECGVTDPCLAPEYHQQQKQARLAMEKRIGDFHLERKRIDTVPGGDDIDEFELDGFDADGDSFSLNTADTGLRSPNTPITEHSLKQIGREPPATNDQDISETPFTKTLNYYKHFKGEENTPIKRRRDTALLEEIAEVTELAVNAEDLENFLNIEEAQSEPLGEAKTYAEKDVQDLASFEAREDIGELSNTMNERNVLGHFTEPTTTALQSPTDGDEISTADDSKKQLILYPQHPPLITAIGMIPATMFWITAAPIVKYTNVTVEYLIDTLRDIYL
ncbi:hypothetical protein E8E13_003604 [Curvularia kusanoi]|uniref:Uncharacterized protein n=1 Tax=Curvularia kusanoi TaxID=90978 RepID=A0A9P4WAG9_CURKU|nr:hypothetical protein E8E13_003604 [Curvularia kusanoi]